MRRRALLASLAGAAALSGCGAGPATTGDGTVDSEDRAATEASGPTVRDVFNPTGRAVARPLGDPLVRGGLTSDTDQYLHARLFRPGDSVAVTDDGSWLAESVDALTDGEFALLTNLRTAAAAPAYWWPERTGYDAGTLRIEVARQSSVSVDAAGAEAVGVALTTFEYDGRAPEGADVVFPSGATIRVGSRA